MKIVLNPIKPALCDGRNDFHVLVRLQSEPDATLSRTPLNLVLVIDRSGSMGGQKLAEAKRCAIELVHRMAPEDRVGMIQFDDDVDVVLDLQSVEAAMGVLQPAVSSIRANGSTNLHAGWLKASELLAPYAGGEAVCHVMLLSDGLANRGIVSPAQICHQVESLANAGVTTTTVGLGSDFNEQLMTAMAQSGWGRAHYGERAIDLAETFDAEMGLLTQLQWRSVTMRFTRSPSDLEMLNDYAQTDGRYQMPAIAVGSECWALVKMTHREALRQQHRQGYVLEVEVSAVDSAGERCNFRERLEVLPEVDQGDYDAIPSHELVQRRIDELRAAAIQLRIRDAALRGDWRAVEHILNELEDIGRREPWVASSIQFIRSLMHDRDQERMSKEMMYKSRKMAQRLASTNESDFNLNDDSRQAAFLRRKMAEGRRSEPGNSV